MNQWEGCIGVPFELHHLTIIALYFLPLLSSHSPFCLDCRELNRLDNDSNKTPFFHRIYMLYFQPQGCVRD